MKAGETKSASTSAQRKRCYAFHCVGHMGFFATPVFLLSFAGMGICLFGKDARERQLRSGRHGFAAVSW